MIDVKEHFYNDDPSQGHPDVRTKLKDVSYFFLGNGLIQAAVQIAPSGEGTPVGLLIMDPESLGKKREALTFDPDTGLKNTKIRIKSNSSDDSAEAEVLEAGWFKKYPIPAVKVQWKTCSFLVVEQYYCPDLSSPVLFREVCIKNLKKNSVKVDFQTGVLKKIIKQEFSLAPEGERRIFLRYTLESAKKHVFLNFISEGGADKEALEFWEKKACISFDSPILDHYINASKFQLPAVISSSGKVDGSIWQYNREWVRDQAMMTVGLTLSGHHGLARKMIFRLFKEFVTEEGDTIDSSEKRHPDEVELDQNGVLLYALVQYVLWTADYKIITENWDKIVSTAEFPLKSVFNHSPSGLLANRREYWERHRVHGIDKGMEITYQLWASIGLSSAATLARLVSRASEALRWDREAERIKNAILSDTRYGLVDGRGFIKRRRINGSVQEAVKPLLEAQLPEGAPLSSEGIHLLNPDASVSLPIALGFIPADSSVARATMANLENLWNQVWEGGGYGRYHASSEPDSPGPWPFPSLFIARSYAETGDLQNVWRVLQWLETLPGARAGSWFEFYGHRLAPPFPQVGITPWTWAEMLILLIHHIIGIQPEMDYLRIRPRLLPGIKRIKAILPLRNGKLDLEIKRSPEEKSFGFRSNGTILEFSDKEAKVSYLKDKLWVKASLPE